MPDRNRASFRKIFARFHDTSPQGSASAVRPRWRIAVSLELVILMVAIFFGSFEIRVGYATCGLRREKSSLPAIRKMTVRMVSSRV